MNLTKKRILGLFLVLICLVITIPIFYFSLGKEDQQPNFFVGTMELGNNSETQRNIDLLKDNTNLIIISNIDVIRNVSSLDYIVNYAFSRDLYFVVRMQYPTPNWKFNYNPFEWQQTAQRKYGSHFLGFYIYDEPGGNQLDQGNFRQFDKNTMPSSYQDATNTYVYYLFAQMRDFVKTSKVFTSDFGLYWFDYEAGYDTVLTEFVGNQSRSQSIALCRGAAEMHNKTWGVTITWKYDNPPYIEDGNQLYNDMITAYTAGASYVVLFNYPSVGVCGVLTQEHLNALKNFKDYVSSHPQQNVSSIERTAFVLPQDYGCGFGGPNDTIWGVWASDNLTSSLWIQMQNLTATYGNRLDIIYDSLWTRLFLREHYINSIWWNATGTQ